MIVKLNSVKLGIGLYSYADAARILAIPAATLQRWIKPGQGLLARVIAEPEHILTFQELIELHFIKIFRQENVSLKTIICAAQNAAKLYDTEHPFSVKRFDTDGRTIFSTLLEKNKENEAIVEDLAHGQQVFSTIVRPFFKKLEYGNDAELVRYWPQGRSAGIVLDPQRKFGKPIDVESGIATSILYDDSLANPNVDAAEIAKWYGIPTKTVLHAIEYEKSLAA